MPCGRWTWVPTTFSRNPSARQNWWLASGGGYAIPRLPRPEHPMPPWPGRPRPAYMVGVDSGSVLIVTLAWRSAEVAAASSVVILLVALAIRQYLRHEERVRAR